MPKFYEYRDIEVDVDIDIDEFLDKCNNREKDELIYALIEDGYLKKDCRRNFEEVDYSPTEAQFVEAVDKLRNKWNMLSQEEEQLILNIANRF
jgi:hypothetical protein